MKIIIDSGPLSDAHGVRGIGTYVRELTKHLTGIEIADIAGNPDIIKKYDVVHFTSFKPFSVSLPYKKPPGAKFVLTIYDLIPLIYPKHYPPGIRGKIEWEINKYLIKKNVDEIITISETSKKDICRFLGTDPNKVHVTYLASGEIFKKQENESRRTEKINRFGLPKRFALYVGDINYNKNIPNLVKACRLAKIPLVIAGKQAGEIEKMDLNHPELIHLKDVNWENVIRLGYVSVQELVNLYNLAACYAQPSFYEGFGLPLLEAHACGVPIAVSKNQCHVEILGPSFEYFDPEDPASIAEAILNPNKVIKLQRNYSWTLAAKKTREVYAKI